MASQVAPGGKERPAMQETKVHPVRKTSGEGYGNPPNILAWKNYWSRKSPAGWRSNGRKELDDWGTMYILVCWEPNKKHL